MIEEKISLQSRECVLTYIIYYIYELQIIQFKLSLNNCRRALRMMLSKVSGCNAYVFHVYFPVVVDVRIGIPETVRLRD